MGVSLDQGVMGSHGSAEEVKLVGVPGMGLVEA